MLESYLFRTAMMQIMITANAFSPMMRRDMAVRTSIERWKFEGKTAISRAIHEGKTMNRHTQMKAAEDTTNKDIGRTDMNRHAQITTSENMTDKELDEIKRKLLPGAILETCKTIIFIITLIGIPYLLCQHYGVSVIESFEKNSLEKTGLFIMIGTLAAYAMDYIFSFAIEKHKIANIQIYKSRVVAPTLKKRFGVRNYLWNTELIDNYSFITGLCSTTANACTCNDFFNACYRGIPLIFLDGETHIFRATLRLSNIVLSLPFRVTDDGTYILRRKFSSLGDS